MNMDMDMSCVMHVCVPSWRSRDEPLITDRRAHHRGGGAGGGAGGRTAVMCRPHCSLCVHPPPVPAPRALYSLYTTSADAQGQVLAGVGDMSTLRKLGRLWGWPAHPHPEGSWCWSWRRRRRRK